MTPNQINAIADSERLLIELGDRLQVAQVAITPRLPDLAELIDGLNGSEGDVLLGRAELDLLLMAAGTLLLADRAGRLFELLADAGPLAPTIEWN